MRFVSCSVITGFVNALAILIFMAQLRELIGVPAQTYFIIAGGLAIISSHTLPSDPLRRWSPTRVSLQTSMDLRTVGDLDSPSTLPFLTLPQVPLTWETLQIIFHYSVTLAAVGCLNPC